MDIKASLLEQKSSIEAMIYPYTKCEDGYNDPIVKAMDYSYQAGGKRLRPMIISNVYKMLSNDQSIDITPYMAAMEMIHTSSLIHDDLPAMDNDDLRRGKPTNHKVFGEDMAILAGDGLLLLASEVMMADIEKYPELSRIKACKSIIDASGVSGMVGGQVVDIMNEEGKIDEETLLYIHEHKTGALLTASFLAGGYLAKADDKTIKQLRKIGGNIGLAFQIQDDILDVIGDEDELGKPLMSDAKNSKDTYVTINGLAKSKQIMNTLLDEAIELLTEIEADKSLFLQGLIRFLGSRKY